MSRKRTKKTGLTLVEIMVAATIFALVTAGAFAGLTQGLNISESARRYTRAMPIVQSEFESLRSLTWAELDALPKSTTVVTLTPTSSIDANYYAPYTIQREIFSVSTTLLRVEVRITFQPSMNSSSTVTLNYTSFFTEGGANEYYYRQI